MNAPSLASRTEVEGRRLPRAPRAMDRAAAWVPRLTAGTTLLVIAILAAASAAYLAREAAQSYQQTAAADEAALRAEIALRQATQVIDDVRETLVQHAQVTKLQPHERCLLQSVRRFHIRLAKNQFELEPLTRETLAAHGHIGDISKALGDWSMAERAYQTQISLLRRAPQAMAASGESRRMLAASQIALAQVTDERCGESTVTASAQSSEP